MNAMTHEFTSILDAYRDAVLARDVDALVALYHPDARIFDAWGVWSYEGRTAWRKPLTAWLTSHDSEQYRVAFDDVQVVKSADMAVLTSIVTYSGWSVEGKELRAIPNRLTWTLQREGTAWTIVHEHTSSPLGFEDGKGILQRN